MSFNNNNFLIIYYLTFIYSDYNCIKIVQDLTSKIGKTMESYARMLRKIIQYSINSSTAFCGFALIFLPTGINWNYGHNFYNPPFWLMFFRTENALKLTVPSLKDRFFKNPVRKVYS